ncbi:conserved hypothetical protein [Hyphomicrobiales bacterium]|nr:conserved hypothetical protein [Hyphomicrobiales bacterium]CAH1673459.1 conserved hypothetical protein [Hyphomicrobiales bacterium]
MPVRRLEVLHSKVVYAVGMATQARDHVQHPGGLWYHAVGMLNAYYALREELTKRTKNTNDQHLRAAIDAWLQAKQADADAFFGNARNIATHQGDIQVEYFTEWEVDTWNDTSRPVRSAKVSVKGGLIDAMPGDEFLSLCTRAMTFLRDGIEEIDRDYKSRGGTEHGLSEHEDLSALFDGMKL